MNRLRAFGLFWYDFIVGDDWTIALTVIVGVAGAALLAHHHVTAWFVLPVLVAGVLAISVWRAIPKDRAKPDE